MLLEIGGTVVAVCLGVAILLYLVQRVVPHSLRAKHNDVAGFVYAVLGVLFAVMLGFVVVDEWESMEATKQNTFAEANELGTLYWNSRALPAAQGRDLERTTKEYAEEVINVEWRLMGTGQVSERATNLVYDMRDEINALPTETPREQVVFQQSLSDVNGLEAARRQRIFQSSESVPTVLWVALVLGAVLTIGYTFLFGLPRLWAHLLIAAPLGVLVVLTLVVIDQLNHPFTGLVSLSPDAFRIFLDRLPAQR